MIASNTKFRAPPLPRPPVVEPIELPSQTAKKPEHHPNAVFVDTPIPWDHRALSWWIRQIETPRRLVRFLSWVFRGLATWYGKLRSLIVVLKSPKVSPWAFGERQGICACCPENDGGYCRACKCWRWPLAKLVRKNRRTKWLCPLAQHPGTYPRYTRGNCPGCGRHAKQPIMERGHV